MPETHLGPGDFFGNSNGTVSECVSTFREWVFVGYPRISGVQFVPIHPQEFVSKTESVILQVVVQAFNRSLA